MSGSGAHSTQFPKGDNWVQVIYRMGTSSPKKFNPASPALTQKEQDTLQQAAIQPNIRVYGCGEPAHNVLRAAHKTLTRNPERKATKQPQEKHLIYQLKQHPNIYYLDIKGPPALNMHASLKEMAAGDFDSQNPLHNEIGVLTMKCIAFHFQHAVPLTRVSRENASRILPLKHQSRFSLNFGTPPLNEDDLGLDEGGDDILPR